MELYDLQSDKSETRNRLMEQSDRIEELQHELERREREYIHPFINLHPVAYVKPP